MVDMILLFLIMYLKTVLQVILVIHMLMLHTLQDPHGIVKVLHPLLKILDTNLLLHKMKLLF